MRKYVKKARPFWVDYDQEQAILKEEEMIMRKENLEARKNIGRTEMKKLQDAICIRALIDYQNAITICKTRNREETIEECEEFFNTDMFKASTGIKDPQKVKLLLLNLPTGHSIEKMLK